MPEVFRGGWTYPNSLLPEPLIHWMEEEIIDFHLVYRRSKCGLEFYDRLSWDTDEAITCPDCMERLREEAEVEVPVEVGELVGV